MSEDDKFKLHSKSRTFKYSSIDLHWTKNLAMSFHRPIQ
jgi:hypothetical protein